MDIQEIWQTASKLHGSGRGRWYLFRPLNSVATQKMFGRGLSVGGGVAGLTCVRFNAVWQLTGTKNTRTKGLLGNGWRIRWLRGWVGSWTFIVVQSMIVMVWMALNVVAVVYRWDPYPFILLNSASMQAAYAAPIIKSMYLDILYLLTLI